MLLKFTYLHLARSIPLASVQIHPWVQTSIYHLLNATPESELRFLVGTMSALTPASSTHLLSSTDTKESSPSLLRIVVVGSPVIITLARRTSFQSSSTSASSVVSETRLSHLYNDMGADSTLIIANIDSQAITPSSLPAVAAPSSSLQGHLFADVQLTSTQLNPVTTSSLTGTSLPTSTDNGDKPLLEDTLSASRFTAVSIAAIFAGLALVGALLAYMYFRRGVKKRRGSAGMK
ncbi:hypothetical protein EJ05DRAFT_219345 [Pseudovirgaria hyperparasitica]|uniref:Uncharacterized protein n=1 Tax=Pseudovirgaria hyperparasitica TaxID=470096 RepID=A0A6A6VTF0_9PEZI|nr:uncharacterized protein EJ05DRAFT_219345 [Pseudovirgaria hyperparasitica]KAF2753493.1 hypothetical protein EJ05DRAFT_219345 [Pseudovirgaria hyperparasitica]